MKESDRLAAMAAELAKCGVAARELPDGIEVEGRGGDLARWERERAERGPVFIRCYDDHRLAMAFSVIAAR